MIEDYQKTAYTNLWAAVIRQAARDYLTARKKLTRTKLSKEALREARGTVRECTRFFREQRPGGVRILAKLQEIAESESFRKRSRISPSFFSNFIKEAFADDC